MRAVVDGQVQRVNTCTARIVGVCVSVCTCLVVGHAMPYVAFANCRVEHIVRAIVHRQMQRVNINTTISIDFFVGIGINTRRSINNAMPFVTFTHNRIIHIMCAVVHRQVQRVDTCATRVVGVRVSVGTCLVVGLTIPHIAFADCRVERVVCTVVDGQV